MISSGYFDPGVPLTYSSNGDTNGVFYYLATNALSTSWVNPIVAGSEVDPSTAGAVPIQVLPGIFFNSSYGVNYATDRGASSEAMYIAELNADQRNWATFDLGAYALQPDFYTIMGRAGYNANFLSNWILEGSNDNTHWDTLDTRTSDTQQGLGIWGTYTPTASQAYRYLRIRGTGVDSSGNLFLGIGEIEFYGQLQPFVAPSLSNTDTLTYSSNGDTNGLMYFIGTEELNTSWSNPISSRRVTTYVNGQYGDYNYYPYRSVDRGADSRPWHSNGAAGTWIIYDLGGYAIQPTDYTIKGRADYSPGSYLRNWDLEGTNDLSGSWDTLDSRTTDTQQGDNTWGYYTASASQSYRYIRLRSTGVSSDGGNYFIIGEVEFYGDVSY